MVNRKQNWPLLLSAFLRDRKDAAFIWGANDCLMFAADAVLALTGFDPAAQWRGRYSTKEEAEALLHEFGGVPGLITKGLGIEGHDKVLKAKRGDVVMVSTDAGLAGGVIDDRGTGIAVPTPEGNGWKRLPLSSAVKVWGY